jgi:long-subunit fatty acid transport protein
MRMKTFYISAAIILCTANLSFAQIDKNGGSLYSIFGLGDLSYSASTRTDAMGIMGIALYGKYSNGINPAAWTRIPNTRFTTKVDLGRISSSDGLNTAKRNFGGFETFGLSIPLNQGSGWIFDLSMHNYSSVNYDTKFTGTSLGQTYTQSYSGNGGLERISLGFSYIILHYLSFGVQFNYAYGNIVKNTQIVFDDPNLIGVQNTLSNQLSGFYINSGLIFHGFGKIFKNKKLDNMTFGVSFSSPFKINSTITGDFKKSTTTDSITITSGKIQMPYALGIGISNEFNNKYVVAADVYMQNWSSYTYYGVHPDEIKNNFRAGLGFEYTPSKKIEDSYFKRVSYRLGGNYTVDYLKLNGESINAIGVNAGLSLPVSRFNSLDLVFSYITRGKTTNGLIQDKTFRLGASINIGELWFLRPSEN